MKKLGLRVLAGSLAALMVASTFAPVKTASATNGIVIAPAPISVKTLYITEDMVDEDGEIVISGENWERVVVSKEVAADKIYFDQVTVGELVVESGSKTNIELWGVDAEKLTVQEPEIKKLSLNELLPLLADKETQQAAIDTYLKNKTENERALNTAPSIVTKEDAKVDTLVVRANAALNLETGEVGAVALEASDKLERAKVTLKNYNGDVTYKGGENFNSMTLRNVDSRIKTLTVDESSANNYFSVTAKNSVVVKAEVAGNAQVSLNAPMGTIEITEAASAAKVCVLNAADEMKVAASGAKVEVAMSGSVATATVTGDNVNIGGAGNLSEVAISGKGAYVSTNGTKVEGENTYVKPVYVEPEKPKTEMGELPEGSKIFLPKDTGMGGYGHSKEVLENGAVNVSFDDKYQEIQFNLPSEVDLSLYDKMVVTMESPSASDSNAVVFKVIATGAEKDQYNNPTPFKEVWGVVKYPGGDVEVDLSGFEDKKVCRFSLMANNGSCSATVYRIAFVPKAGVTPPTEDDTPAAPSVLPEGYAEFKFADLSAASEGNWGNVKTPAGFHDGVKIAYSQQYATAKFALPEKVEISEYEKMIVTMSSAVNGIMFVIFDEAGTELGVWYGRKSVSTTDFEIDLTKPDEFWQGPRDIPQDGNIKYIALQANDEGESSTVAYRVAFVPRETGEEQIKEFYIAKDVAFNKTSSGASVDVGGHYLDGSNFVNLLPAALKADDAVAEKFTTLSGILEMVDYFEVEVTLTEGTAVSEDKAGYAPQSQVYLQSSDYKSGTFGKVIGNIGQPSEGVPKKGSVQHPTSLCSDWDAPTVGKIGIQILNAMADTTLSGSYSIKVVLK